mmetsp:Transcript_10438/g.21657  ORF Transcript_10438/g.21657 Transcript_10438/m.21657 type:complete len:1175 (+) Transcript_10438:84-3608(+)
MSSRTEPKWHRLESLLSKLRPFQRKAYDFAVHGFLLADHAEGGEGSEENEQSHENSVCNGRQAVGSSDGKQFAGAGTGRILLGDEMGLGKTITSLAIMLAYQSNEWPLLILCPASLRYTWPAEIEKFCPWIPSTAIHVVKGKDDVQFAVKIQRWRKKKLDEADNKKSLNPPVQIVIVTYSLLQSRFAIANTLKDCNFQCVIADESHNLKQLSSQRCQLALPLLQNSTRLVLLSGTPALNRPVELWPQLSALDPKGNLFGKFGMRYNEYTKRFCNAKRTRFGWDVKGVSNAEELHACLKTVMVRRLKSDVLHDLPAKQRSIVPVNVDREKEGECRERMTQLALARRAVSDVIDFDDDETAKSAQWEARRLLMDAYQASGIAKAPATTEYILDWLEGSSQKLVVFAHHKLVLDYIEDAIFKKYNGRLGVIRIDGSVPPAERALSVRKFQTNSSVRLALLSMTAAGVGLTLTAASSIIFCELHFVPGVLAQAEDRCHRIGQANAVNVMYCICKDEDVSVDSYLWKMLGRKVNTLGRVVDGERKGLNAVEQTSEGVSQSCNNRQTGVSAEEELSLFFARENTSSAMKTKSTAVAKGSIQSFFKKNAVKSDAKNKNPQSTLPTQNPSTISLLGDEDDSAALEPNVAQHSNSKLPQYFSCQKCTFQNSINLSSCSMCGTPREAMIGQGHFNTKEGKESISPSRSRQSTPEIALTIDEAQEWACSTCTFINTSTVPTSKLLCVMCGSAKESIITNTQSVVDDKKLDTMKPSSLSKKKLSQYDIDDSGVEVIAIDDEDDGQLKKKSRCHVQTEVLSFSVSKNSGRIALHLSSTGQPLHINFDVNQVLTKECAERLEEVQFSRISPSRSDTTLSNIKLDFDARGVKQVLSVLNDSSALPHDICFGRVLDTMCHELRSFVSIYLSLREIEKKVIKESGLSVSPVSLRQIVAKLLTSTVTGSTTDRYRGGAKERALENLKNNCATPSDEDVIHGRACAWCAKPLFCASTQIIEATYCSQSCAEEGRIRRGGWYSSTNIREQLFALECGVCRKCNLNAYALFCRVKALAPSERLNALLNANWKLPSTKISLDRLLASPKEQDFWQADHIVPVAEGGGGCGLDNLRTLCTPCHAAETASLRFRRKGLPALSQGSNDVGSGSQMDIMSAFSNAKNAKKKRTKRRRPPD